MDSSRSRDWDFTTITLGAARGCITESNGKSRTLSFSVLRQAILGHSSLLLCHRLNVARRLRIETFPAFDVLELFAFVHPAVRCIPTPWGLATALGMRKPESDLEEGEILRLVTLTLLETLSNSDPTKEPDILAIAEAMRSGKWEWADKVCAMLRHHRKEEERPRPRGGLDVWVRLPAWSEHGPEPTSESHGVDPAEARIRLSELVGDQAEDRPEQGDYTSAVTPMFAPREKANLPKTVIAEAGTGVGKTLGYIAPASIWAEKNSSPVWISTYTKHLQRQIDTELEKLYPDPEFKKRQVVIRKGRENYLCLLNLEEAVNGINSKPGTVISIGLVARWAFATRDGDINGGDFPSWLSDLLGFRNTLGLSDRRGECIFSACAHYNKCFIERTIRQSRFADIVVSNHALVMTQAALGGIDDSSIPTRLIFDEGHHVFDAADSAFSAEISGRQGAELRHWILGTEGLSGRGRGLAKRIQDFAAIEPKIGLALTVVQDAATCLPSSGWQLRVGSGSKPKGPAEDFLSLVRQQTYARAKHTGSDYELEADVQPLIPGLFEAAELFEAALNLLSRPMKKLAAELETFVDQESATLQSTQRQRIEAVCRGLKRRSEVQIDGWRSMLSDLAHETSDQYVEWFSVNRVQGNDVDAAMHRHWIDPSRPFAETVIKPAHGVLLTSATLRDGTGDLEFDWESAEQITGATHLTDMPVRALLPSPFNYKKQSKIFIITDVARDNTKHVAAAFRELFIAANGGSVGLFTAIARLKAVHSHISESMEEAGLRLLAQHVDPMDTGSLIDIFKAERDSCILGTDAIRDGVDVPGKALRLLVFDRVPWPRPTIIHRARKKQFGSSKWDDRITRLRIKQAFGRLVRHGDDKGVFVMLDPRMPSRLLGAFPEKANVERVGLKDAVDQIRTFLDNP